MNPETDWLTAIIIVAAGIGLGLMLLYVNRRRKAVQIPRDSWGWSDLEGRRDALLEQLRDPALEGAERLALEVETAGVLRQLEGLPHERAVPASAPPPAPLAPALRGFAWGVGVFAMLGVLAFFVVEQMSPRVEAAAPVPVVQSQAKPVEPARDLVLEELKASVLREPENLDLRLSLARAHLDRDNLMEVHEEAQVVLKQRPEDSKALTLQAIVRAAMGEGDRATKMLQRAVRSDSQNLDGWVALAWVQAQNGKLDDAEATMTSAIRAVPSEKEMLEKVLGQIRTRVKTASQTLPAGHPK